MATTTPNLQTLAAAWGVSEGQIPIVVDLIKRSMLLQTATVAKASHGTKHKYRYFNTLPTAVFREIGEGITPQKIDTNWATVDLKEIVFDLYDDYLAIEQYPGGKDKWVSDNTPAVLAAIGNAMCKAIYYGYDATFGYSKAFKGLHQYAKDLSQVVAQKGGTTGSRTSIFAVRWDELDGASLRYNNTDLLNVKDLTPTQPIPMVTNTTTNTQLDIYKWKVSSYMSLVIPSAKSVAAITQVDASNPPTAGDMNALLDAVGADSGNVYIYTSDLGRRAISKIKDGKLNMFVETSSYDNRVPAWREAPIYADQNILTTETTVLD